MIELNKKQKIIIAIILLFVIIVIGYYIYDITTLSNNQSIENIDTFDNSDYTENLENTNNVEIIVHVAGAVENEGIQHLNENSRVADAIDAAGGLTSDANSNNINLAQKISDGQKIYIPFYEDSELNENNNNNFQIIDDNTSSSTDNSSNALVNINIATQTELETLPGIGPSTALKIINYRKENGNFKSIDDIKNVTGIGDSKFEKIKDKICV